MEEYQTDYIREEEPLTPVLVHAMCKCGGEYRASETYIVRVSLPPQYPHQCEKCGDLKSFTNIYPHIAYKTATGEIL